MGMPITIHVVDLVSTKDLLVSAAQAITKAFEYFDWVDRTFSTYKNDSEVMRINRGELALADASPEVQQIWQLAEQTKQETDGFFDMRNRAGIYDPSGIVKGWAIHKAALLIRDLGFANYSVDAGGDIEVHGHNAEGGGWRIGIQNPFKPDESIKTVHLRDAGIATSGTYIRGQHIYIPADRSKDIADIVSLTVIGPDVYEADRFATAAFAMGLNGIAFVEKLPGLEGYIIDARGTATMTSGFEQFTNQA